MHAYFAAMSLGYATSFMLGVASFMDRSWNRASVSLLYVLYTTDVVACSRGVICMRSIPAKNVMRHHLPVIVMLTRLLYDHWMSPELARVDALDLIVASLGLTSANEAVWVGSRFLSKPCIDGVWYPRLHTSLTTCMLAQVIACTGYGGGILLYTQSRYQIEGFCVLLSLSCVQIPLFINASSRLLKKK